MTASGACAVSPLGHRVSVLVSMGYQLSAKHFALFSMLSQFLQYSAQHRVAILKLSQFSTQTGTAVWTLTFPCSG